MLGCARIYTKSLPDVSGLRLLNNDSGGLGLPPSAANNTSFLLAAHPRMQGGLRI